MAARSPEPGRNQAKWDDRPERAESMPSPRFRPARLLLAPLLGVASLLPAAALAQSESYILGPGSNIGPATKIKPTNCTTAADGTVTCDTTVVNPKGDTPARPQYSPFSN